MIVSISTIVESFLIIYQYFQQCFSFGKGFCVGPLGTFGEVHTAATFLMTVFPLCVDGLFRKYLFMPVVGYGTGFIIGCAIIATGSKLRSYHGYWEWLC